MRAFPPPPPPRGEPGGAPSAPPRASQTPAEATVITTADQVRAGTGLRLHQAGDEVAGYTLVTRVKSGGMGSLWIGQRSGMGGFAKRVAIKVIHPHLAENQDFVRMFLDEARLTARIHHPNVIQVNDVGIERGCHFMVMELVPGCSLADVNQVIADRGRRMRPDLAVAIVREVAAGLHAAHELRGDAGQPLHVVHRDVSPDNVLIGLAGAVKLIDFGIAKATERLHQTRQPTLKGKLRYLAPEQLDGHNDRRTDVFALGIVLWELLTGQRIYESASEAELLERVRDPQIPSVRELAPELGPQLDAVIATMTALSPDDRPATAADAAAMLVEAMPAVSFVGADQIGQLAMVAASTGLGVGDGEETATPTAELAPLTAERRKASALTTARVAARRVTGTRPESSSHAAMWLAAALVTFALIVAAGIVWDGTRTSEPEIRAMTLTPSSGVPSASPSPSTSTSTSPSPSPSPSPSTSTSPSTSPSPSIPPSPPAVAAPPPSRTRGARPTTDAPERTRRPPSTSSTDRASHSVVDGTTLATEL